MMVRWLVRIFVLLCLALLAGFAWVYVASERHLRSFERPTPFSASIPTDPVSIEHGDHLVRTRGCRGCHGDDLGGQIMFGSALAPNLAAYARSETAATFEAALRHGIGRDDKAMYFMPSYNFIRLRDEDVAAMYAYLRTVPVVERELVPGNLPWAIRVQMALGNDAAIAGFLNHVPKLQRSGDSDPGIARGEYIAMTTCNECHGFSLRADVPWEVPPEEKGAPDLLIVMAYDKDAFTHLMRTGKATGDRELEMMSGVARGRFAYFTDQEIDDVYRFLTDMSDRASSSQ